MLADCKDLTEYLGAFAPVLGRQIAERIKPLHTPATDPVVEAPYRRPPLPAQAHVITATVKQWQAGRKTAMVCADPGTGKSLVAAASVRAHSAGAPYRAVVTCPPHLVEKWLREIDDTIEAEARIVSSYREVVRINWREKPKAGEWYILSNSTAKLGTNWKPVADTHWNHKYENIYYCTDCTWPITKKDPNSNVPLPLTLEEIGKRRIFCESCGSALWQWSNMYERWPVADYLHKRAKGHIDYLVVDEVHESKGDSTAIGNSVGSLAATARHVLTLTGTILGGYAEHLFATLYRVGPQSLVEEGIGWGETTPFNERYGRIERRVTTVTQDSRGGRDNAQSQGKVKSCRSTKYVRPGVMPTLYGRHLIDKAIFLSLNEVADDLPPFSEEVISVEMDKEMGEEYQRIEQAIASHLKGMLSKGSSKLLGMMLSVLLGYPDKSTGWEEIGYEEYDVLTGINEWVPVVTPKELNQKIVRPKERELIEYLKAEHAAGRQSWVYTTMTNKRDVTQRLKRLCLDAGLRTEVLTAAVNTRKREEWIERTGPTVDVCISHPMLVQTGLDLFDKKHFRHNFSTLIFYMTGYNTFVLRQAALRAFRIGQRQECKVSYFHYANTMQARAMTLMGRKLVASQAIEGKFSSDGLAAMAGDDASMETALARSLVENLEDLDVGRAWAKLGAAPERQPIAPARPKQTLHFDEPLIEFGSQPKEEEEVAEPKMNSRTRRLMQKFLFAGN